MTGVDPAQPHVGRFDTDPPPTGERFDVLVEHGDLTVEHIVSTPTASDELYDQAQDELAVLLAGAAILEIEGTSHQLAAGDWCWLPAHTPHRVIRTEPGTRWLAVHLRRGD